MALTLALLEKVMVSEVENLHLRIDTFVEPLQQVESRLSSLERQVSVLYLAVEDLKVSVAYLMTNCAMKSDLAGFARKEDFANFATREDLAGFATKEDLAGFATKADLARFATKADIANFVTKDDLEVFFQRIVKLINPLAA